MNEGMLNAEKSAPPVYKQAQNMPTIMMAEKLTITHDKHIQITKNFETKSLFF